jgi:hypothetical protein
VTAKVLAPVVDDAAHVAQARERVLPQALVSEVVAEPFDVGVSHRFAVLDEPQLHPVVCRRHLLVMPWMVVRPRAYCRQSARYTCWSTSRALHVHLAVRDVLGFSQWVELICPFGRANQEGVQRKGTADRLLG